MSKSARLWTDFLISAIAVLTKKLGSFVCVRANSVTSYFISANALSRTIPAILGSRSPCNKAVAAPIERPQRPTVLTFLSLLRWLTITLTSSLSCQPSEINSPSDLPHPGKSKQTSVIFAYKTKGTSSIASIRQELFPCRYTMQGISSHCLTSSAGSKWEHWIFWPRAPTISKSERTTFIPAMFCSGGPMSFTLYWARGGLIIAFQS